MGLKKINKKKNATSLSQEITLGGNLRKRTEQTMKHLRMRTEKQINSFFANPFEVPPPSPSLQKYTKQLEHEHVDVFYDREAGEIKNINSTALPRLFSLNRKTLSFMIIFGK